LINPANLFNEIASRVFERIPGGEAFHSRLISGRTANAASASRAVANSNTRPDANNATSFNSIMQYFSTGGDVDDATRKIIEAEIEAASARHNIDPNLVRAVIRAESNYRTDAVSSAGAMGLMQLMPGTATSLGVTNPFDIAQNIDGGTAYLRRMLDAFDQDLDLALAAYNAGSGAVRRHGGIPPFAETQRHVPRVRQFFEEYTLMQYQRAAEDSRFSS